MGWRRFRGVPVTVEISFDHVLAWGQADLDLPNTHIRLDQPDLKLRGTAVAKPESPAEVFAVIGRKRRAQVSWDDACTSVTVFSGLKLTMRNQPRTTSQKLSKGANDNA